MTNSYIFTARGLSVVVRGKALTVEETHMNYAAIVDAIVAEQWDTIASLIDGRQVVAAKIAEVEQTELSIDGSDIKFRGVAVDATLQTHILKMIQYGLPLSPINSFLVNLYNNPSKKAVDEAMRWITSNGITISPDGFLYVYKRVNNNFTSMYDNTTMNAVGTFVEMPRNAVDDRSENTCSAGLHFCSHAYLPEYNSGQGKILQLKLNPADIVSIPTDYNSAKGRACKYFVEAYLSGEASVNIEVGPIVAQPVVLDVVDVNATEPYKVGYLQGYKDGRGKQTKYKSDTSTDANGYIIISQSEGYLLGFTEGRAKQPKRF